MTQDAIENLPGAVLQHGPFGNRVYIMKLRPECASHIVETVAALATRHGYTKLFGKIPESALPVFQTAGYHEEARIPGLYGPVQDGVFVARFLSPEREHNFPHERIQEVLAFSREKAAVCDADQKTPPAGFLERATESDADELARLYAAVFASYPFPITDPVYIRQTMRTHIDYYMWRTPNGDMIAAASAEKDIDSASVEMTDFATAPAARGQGLAELLLERMESDMRGQGMHTVYTIARALSVGINIVFCRRGFVFGGTLVNNTGIAGSIESMNVWHKPVTERMGNI